MMLDVVAAGHALVDHCYHLAALPRPGSGARILASYDTPGGLEANVLAALARLGARVGLIGRVGDDVDGQRALADLDAWGIDRQRAAVVPGLRSDYCVIWTDPAGERMICCGGDGVLGMLLTSEDEAYAASARVAFASAFVPLDVVAPLFRRARLQRHKTALDLADVLPDLEVRGLRREALVALIVDVDLFLCNGLSLSTFMDVDDPLAAFAAFRASYPNPVLAMTLGTAGAWLARGDEVRHIPAFAVEAADTTGAGDAFHAGLIYGLFLRNWTLERAGRFAAALAALNCRAQGARGGLAPEDEVEAFMDML
jgi:ribokinase/sulfofructose kinase